MPYQLKLPFTTERIHLTVNGMEAVINPAGLTTITEVADYIIPGISLPGTNTKLEITTELRTSSIIAVTISSVNGTPYCAASINTTRSLAVGDTSCLCMLAILTFVTLTLGATLLHLDALGVTSVVCIPGMCPLHSFKGVNVNSASQTFTVVFEEYEQS